MALSILLGLLILLPSIVLSARLTVEYSDGKPQMSCSPSSLNGDKIIEIIIRKQRDDRAEFVEVAKLSEAGTWKTGSRLKLSGVVSSQNPHILLEWEPFKAEEDFGVYQCQVRGKNKSGTTVTKTSGYARLKRQGEEPKPTKTSPTTASAPAADSIAVNEKLIGADLLSDETLHDKPAEVIPATTSNPEEVMPATTTSKPTEAIPASTTSKPAEAIPATTRFNPDEVIPATTTFNPPDVIPTTTQIPPRVISTTSTMTTTTTSHTTTTTKKPKPDQDRDGGYSMIIKSYTLIWLPIQKIRVSWEISSPKKNPIKTVRCTIRQGFLTRWKETAASKGFIIIYKWIPNLRIHFKCEALDKIRVKRATSMWDFK